MIPCDIRVTGKLGPVVIMAKLEAIPSVGHHIKFFKDGELFACVVSCVTWNILTDNKVLVQIDTY